MQRKRLFVFFFTTMIFLSTGFSQNPYEYKKRQNRYEGVKAIKVAVPDLELISFTGYREEVPPKSNVILKLKFFMQSDTLLYITAKELFLRKFYLMKPAKVNWQKGWQVFSPWPTNEVIKPLEVKIDQIGLVGRLFHDRIGSGYVVPLLFYHSQLASKVDLYTIHLRSKETLRRVNYALYRSGSRNLLKTETLMKTFLAMVPFQIYLDLSDQEAGTYKLIVKCRIKNRIGGPNRTYTFYHNPVIN